MVHIPFDVRSVIYDDHMLEDVFRHHSHPQYGSGSGEGNNDREHHLHFFRGSAPYQRGYGGRIQTGAGIGNVL